MRVYRHVKLSEVIFLEVSRIKPKYLLFSIVSLLVLLNLQTVFAKIIAVTNSNLSTEIKTVNSWESNGEFFYQLEVSIKNNSSKAVSSWKTSVSLPLSSQLVQGWQGVYSLNETTLTVKNESYNGSLEKGGQTSFGFIYKTTKVAEVTEPVSTTKTKTEKNTVSLPINTKYNNTDDWLHTDGNKILDKDGNEVWLTGINWFGYNTGTNTFDGLWAANLETSIHEIASRGFNLLRVPFSVELIKQWSEGKYPEANYNKAIQNFGSKNSLEIFDYIIEVCQSQGLKVMIDIHSAKTDSMGHMKPLWYDGEITTEDYFNALEWLAQRYKNNDTIIAYDLKNEPHGTASEQNKAIWNNSTSVNNWKYIAETAAKGILAKNPNVLIMVEGTEIYPKNIKSNSSYKSTNSNDYYYNWWGGNLRGVKDNPINLGDYQNKLVYSPHDYGPAVYNQPWFNEGYTFESLYLDCWKDNWFFIHEAKIAPLLIGEWGGFMTEPNLTWMTHLRTLIIKNKLNHTFWCFNANSGDTGGLVKDDFKTWDETKYNFVKPALFGKGLDHQVILGGE